jgi:hypothetical protein
MFEHERRETEKPIFIDHGNEHMLTYDSFRHIMIVRLEAGHNS